jgi:hypothetical protein
MLSNNFPCHGQQQVSVTLTVNAINFQCSATIFNDINCQCHQFSMLNNNFPCHGQQQVSVTLIFSAINFQCSATILHAMVSNNFTCNRSEFYMQQFSIFHANSSLIALKYINFEIQHA